MNPLRLLLAIVAAALLVVLIGWARGATHHHGLEVGSLAGNAGTTALVARAPALG